MYGSLLSQPGSAFGTFERLRQHLDDLFEVSNLPSSIRSVAPGTLPAINVGRTPTHVQVYAYMPGLDMDRIEVTIDRGVLRIAGERASAIPNDGSRLNVYARERGVGRFSRAVALPDDVDASQVAARYRDGVLQVSIARREAVQPTRIQVQ